MDLIEYVKKNKLKSFNRLPFNEVDALILSRIAFYNFDDIKSPISFKQLGKTKDFSVFTNTKNLRASDTNLLKVVARAYRYRNVELRDFYKDYDKDREIQFAAICFYLKQDTVCVSFRGTDGTIVGWKENFNIITMPIIPSQIAADEYLKKIVKNNPKIKTIYPIGHSKGGNLAVYAAANANKATMSKIKTIYNFDGPGFPKEFYDSDGYKKVKDKIVKLMPPQSVIGRIMYDDHYEIIEAEDQLLLQHWPLNWVVEDTQLKRSTHLEAVSNSVDLTLDDLQEVYSDEERTALVNLLFKKLSMSGKEYLDDIIFNKDEFKSFLKKCVFGNSKERKALLGFAWSIYKHFRAHYLLEQKAEDLMYERKRKRAGLFSILKDNIKKNFTR